MPLIRPNRAQQSAVAHACSVHLTNSYAIVVVPAEKIVGENVGADEVPVPQVEIPVPQKIEVRHFFRNSSKW